MTRILLDYDDNAPFHLLVNQLRDVAKASLHCRPQLVIVEANDDTAAGIIQRLRGAGITVRDNREPEAEAPDAPGLPPITTEPEPETPITGADFDATMEKLKAERFERHGVAPLHETVTEGIALGEQQLEKVEITPGIVEWSEEKISEIDQSKREQIRQQLQSEIESRISAGMERLASGEDEKGESLGDIEAASAAGPAEAGPGIAPGHHFETRPDGTQTLRADDPPPEWNGVAADLAADGVGVVEGEERQQAEQQIVTPPEESE